MKCDICFHACDLKEGQTGFCKGRICQNGKIEPANYGRLTSLAIDPIEKKPLANFYPGSLILSAGSYGCSLRCPFCQNHTISQEDLRNQSQYVSPQELVEAAERYVPAGNIGIAFTYNEPMISYEYIHDVAKLAHEKGLKTVVVTSGNASLKALDDILDDVDAFNIDLKGFTQKSYDYVGGHLEMTKAFIEEAAKKAHVEITSLIVPGENDDPQEMEEMAKWIASVDPYIVLHLTRYFPNWKETKKPTEIPVLLELQKRAKKYLKNVLIGNVPPQLLEQSAE